MAHWTYGTVTPVPVDVQPGLPRIRGRVPRSHQWTQKPKMQSSDETWDAGAFEDLFAWIQRALERYARDRDCRHCLRLACEGLDQLRTAPGSASRNVAADVLREQMRQSCLDLEHGDRDWSSEVVDTLLDDLRRLRALLEAEGAARAAPVSGVMPLGSLLRRAPIDLGSSRPEPRPAPGAGQPNSGLTLPDPVPGAGERGTVEELHHARREFQRVLVELMYDRDSSRSFGRLAEVSAGIAAALPGTGCAALFLAVQDLGQRHTLAAIPVSDDLKALLGRVDRQLGHCLRTSGMDSAGGEQEAFAVQSDLLDPLLQAMREALPDVPDTATPQAPGLAETVSGHDERMPDNALDEHGAGFEDLPVMDDTRLERIRSQGQAEMARLAQAFAALEGGTARETAPPDSAGTHAGAALDSGTEGTRARLDEVELWRQRAVEALAQAALEMQGLEHWLAECPFVPVAQAPEDRAVALPPDLGGRLEQMSQAVSASVGNASTALLRQRRAVEDLRDLLFGMESQPRSP